MCDVWCVCGIHLPFGLSAIRSGKLILNYVYGDKKNDFWRYIRIDIEHWLNRRWLLNKIYFDLPVFFFIGWLVGTINHIHKLIQYNNNWIRRYSFVVYACVWECGWWGISGLWPSVILQFHYLIDISPAAFLHPLSLLPTKHRRDLIVILICETH